MRVPSVFKEIYYKPFCPEEFLFHVFRICKVLLGSKFELKNGLVFDKDSQCIRKEDEVIYLGKKESQLLEILCKNSPHVVTYDEIDHHLYKNETLSQDRTRSLVREIRAKIPTICLKTVRSTGYKVERGGLVKFISYMRAKFSILLDQIYLNLQKLLSCLAILTSTIFRGNFDKFALPKHRLFSLSSLPYSYISSNFLHKAISFLL